MELNDFLAHVAMRKPLDTPEIVELLNRMVTKPAASHSN